jgi:hypothetical protein
MRLQQPLVLLRAFEFAPAFPDKPIETHLFTLRNRRALQAH